MNKAKTVLCIVIAMAISFVLPATVFAESGYCDNSFGLSQGVRGAFLDLGLEDQYDDSIVIVDSTTLTDSAGNVLFVADLSDNTVIMKLYSENSLAITAIYDSNAYTLYQIDYRNSFDIRSLHIDGINDIRNRSILINSEPSIDNIGTIVPMRYVGPNSYDTKATLKMRLVDDDYNYLPGYELINVYGKETVQQTSYNFNAVYQDITSLISYTVAVLLVPGVIASAIIVNALSMLQIAVDFVDAYINDLYLQCNATTVEWYGVDSSAGLDYYITGTEYVSTQNGYAGITRYQGSYSDIEELRNYHPFVPVQLCTCMFNFNYGASVMQWVSVY